MEFFHPRDAKTLRNAASDFIANIFLIMQKRTKESMECTTNIAFLSASAVKKLFSS